MSETTFAAGISNSRRLLSPRFVDIANPSELDVRRFFKQPGVVPAAAAAADQADDEFFVGAAACGGGMAQSCGGDRAGGKFQEFAASGVVMHQCVS